MVIRKRFHLYSRPRPVALHLLATDGRVYAGWFPKTTPVETTNESGRRWGTFIAPLSTRPRRSNIGYVGHVPDRRLPSGAWLPGPPSDAASTSTIGRKIAGFNFFGSFSVSEFRFGALRESHAAAFVVFAYARHVDSLLQFVPSLYPVYTCSH
ncbi:hypothetical protein GWI33_020338 [Rhynchophorus ferrugineus]|uniref:Uncharacterized protein n=1 Tax=Rhynchophorus ferrugineus TaxID=354439 RepID=A0A834M4A4_RHYFE|nr:hypothetical protein GWI33_020338 [Rhynchophorus ferrugineus]